MEEKNSSLILEIKELHNQQKTLISLLDKGNISIITYIISFSEINREIEHKLSFLNKINMKQKNEIQINNTKQPIYHKWKCGCSDGTCDGTNCSGYDL